MKVSANIERYSSLPKLMLLVLRGGAELIGYAAGSQLCHYVPRESPHIFVRWITGNSQVQTTIQDHSFKLRKIKTKLHQELSWKGLIATFVLVCGEAGFGFAMWVLYESYLWALCLEVSTSSILR